MLLFNSISAQRVTLTLLCDTTVGWLGWIQLTAIMQNGLMAPNGSRWKQSRMAVAQKIIQPIYTNLLIWTQVQMTIQTSWFALIVKLALSASSAASITLSCSELALQTGGVIGRTVAA